MCGFEGDISFRNESAQPGNRREKEGEMGKKSQRAGNPRDEGKKGRGGLKSELQFYIFSRKRQVRAKAEHAAEKL